MDQKGWFYIIDIVVVFFIFWGGLAYRKSKKENIGFWDAYFTLIGFKFWFTHIESQIALSFIPSAVLTFLIYSNIKSIQSVSYLGARVHPLAYLAFFYVAIPLINGVLYLLGKSNQRLVKIVIYINTIWFAIMIIAVIIFGLSSALITEGFIQ